jgi:ACS family D-galactonate transporter-like MFS transporter
VETSEPKPHTLHWVALALLVLSVGINYVDRGNLGVAAKSIESDLRFPPQHLGILLGGFFWTYSLFQILAGKIIDHWNVNWVYAAAFLLWSAATGLTGLASAFWVIFCLRLVLGASESVAYPAYSKIIATTFPEQLRGAANALIDAGSKVGPALGVLLGVKMIGWLSWRYMFVAIGGASLLWLLPWRAIVPKLGARRLQRASIAAPPYRQIVAQRRFWGTVLGLFGANYTWYFFLSWLPYYFENERHYTHDRLALIASLPFWGVAGASMCFGLLADAVIRRGYNSGRTRQTFVSVGLLCCCAFMLSAALVGNALISNTLLILACVSMGGFSSNHWALTQHLSGAEAAGKWTGLQNCLGNFAGVIAPYVSGVTFERAHSFFPAFVIACGVLLLGVFGYWFVIGIPRPTIWRSGDVTSAPPRTTYLETF